MGIKNQLNTQLLHKFFMGLTTPRQDEEIKQWMESSPENERAFYRERKLFDSILLVADQSQFEAAAAGSRKHSAGVRKVMVRVIKYAAVFALAFITGLLLSRENSDVSDLWHTVNVPAGQRLNIVMPDGTDVWLNAGTTLRYPVAFNGKNRTVELDGQAFFDVTHNPRKPFTVETSKGSVSVLGTQFDLMAYSAEDAFETIVMEGKVKVMLTTDGYSEVVLTPGYKASAIGAQLWAEYVTDMNPYKWREGLICFSNARFRDIMKNFEKYYDIKITVPEGFDPGRLYTGKFRMSDGINHALRVLQRDLQFAFETNTETNSIVIK